VFNAPVMDKTMDKAINDPKIKIVVLNIVVILLSVYYFNFIFLLLA